MTTLRNDRAAGPLRRSQRAALHCLAGAMLAGAAPWALGAPSAVTWELEIIEQGRTVDHFSDTTRLGQARTENAAHTVQHDLNCPAQASNSGPPDITLTRTITLAPTHIDADEASFAIDAREMIEDPPAAAGASGCSLPPEPRVVTASHPGLLVHTDGSWSSWTLIARDPTLVYRLKATLAPAP
jgi:hypothetical protein